MGQRALAVAADPPRNRLGSPDATAGRLSRQSLVRLSIRQRRNISETQQFDIGSNQGQTQYLSRRGEKSVCRIVVSKGQLPRSECDLMGQGSFP